MLTMRGSRELGFRVLFKCRHERLGPFTCGTDTASLWAPLGTQEVKRTATYNYRRGLQKKTHEYLTVVTLIITLIDTVAIATHLQPGEIVVTCPSGDSCPHPSSNVDPELGNFVVVPE